MQKEVETFPDKHSISLTNGELTLLIINAVREKFPEVPMGGKAKVSFDHDMFGMKRARVVWQGLDRPVHVVKK